MAANDWPTTLPQVFQQNGYSEGNYDNVIKSKTDTGPDKRRLKSSIGYLPIAGKMILSHTQKATFYTFLQDVIKYGALPFNFPDPNDNESLVEVYLDSKTISPMSGNSWSLALTLKALF